MRSDLRFLVFQHEAVEHPGSLGDAWRADGIAWDTAELDAGDAIPPLDRYDALVVMGGPMDVWQEAEHPWLVAEKHAIRHFVAELRRPFLGICLGHQLLADALSGAVALAPRPEVGIATVALTEAGRRDPLFRGFGTDVVTLQWHGAEVTRLPPGATVLAGNEACAVQAFRWGAHAYGIQFHPEITEATIAEWDSIAEYGRYLRTALGEDGAVRLAAETRARLPAFTAEARLVHQNFRRILAAELTEVDPTA